MRYFPYLFHATPPPTLGNIAPVWHFTHLYHAVPFSYCDTLSHCVIFAQCDFSHESVQHPAPLPSTPNPFSYFYSFDTVPLIFISKATFFVRICTYTSVLFILWTVRRNRSWDVIPFYLKLLGLFCSLFQQISQLLPVHTNTYHKTRTCTPTDLCSHTNTLIYTHRHTHPQPHMGKMSRSNKNCCIGKKCHKMGKRDAENIRT